MTILKLNSTPAEEIIKQTKDVIQNGGLVIYPTETVYGVGVDATNPEAVQKILRYKSRREGKPLSMAVTNIEMASQYVEINNQAQKLYERFLPGPFTIISHVKQLKSKSSPTSQQSVAPGVASEFGTLGIRIPDYPLLLDIVKTVGVPITSTSANASGKKRPYNIDDIFNNISQKQKNLIDLVIDAGQLPPNKPSTVIDTTLSTPLTVREGDDFENQKSSKIHTTAKVSLTSNSDIETKNIAGKLLLKNWESIKKTGFLIGLNGKLGAGKTIFTKGVAKFLKINEIITSPTYSYMDEYDFERHGIKGKLHHLDVWKIDTTHEAKFLNIPDLLLPNNVVIIEWWDQVKDIVIKEISKKDKNYLEISIKTSTDVGKENQRILDIYHE